MDHESDDGRRDMCSRAVGARHPQGEAAGLLEGAEHARTARDTEAHDHAGRRGNGDGGGAQPGTPPLPVGSTQRLATPMWRRRERRSGLIARRARYGGRIMHREVGPLRRLE